MRTVLSKLLYGCLLATVLLAADPPSCSIASKYLRAQVYLPNPDIGYYRGSRFDWSGVVAKLEYKGHQYFGVWFPHYDPHLHDAITGPVEEFRSATVNGDPLGFDDAKPGGPFVKVGVGVLRKPDDKPYSFSRGYDIVNPGKWASRPHSDGVEFQQDLTDDAGYDYRYQKSLRLSPKRPELIIEHRLRNTGRKVIETEVYDHDFYVIDGQPTGPDFSVKFAFDAQQAESMHDLAQVKGRELLFLGEFGAKDMVQTLVTGFHGTVAENDIRVENRKTGAGVRETWDRPITKLNFWAIRKTLCPEAYIHMRIDPGKEFRWTIRYEFYEIAKTGPEPQDTPAR